VGVDYINFNDYRGIYGEDILQLEMTEHVWFDVPLYALSRRNGRTPAPPSPFGFKFAHPILLRKGLKARFYTNQNVGKNDIHLLFYGYFTPNEAEIQKKPVKMIYLRGYAYDDNQTTMRLPIPHAYDLLSYGFLYAYKNPGLVSEFYQSIPESFEGYMELLGKKYLFDEQQTHWLGLYSDLEQGIRMLVNNFNIQRFRVDGNEVMKLALSAVLGSDEGLYTLLEYEKLPEPGMYDHAGGRIIVPYGEDVQDPSPRPTFKDRKRLGPTPSSARGFSQREDRLQKPGLPLQDTRTRYPR
jgi:hypothetical protein